MAKTDMPSPVYCASVPVYDTSVHKTSLLYKCTQNQFTHITSLHTKPVHCANVYMNRIECLVWNVHGQNISYNIITYDMESVWIE